MDQPILGTYKKSCRIINYSNNILYKIQCTDCASVLKITFIFNIGDIAEQLWIIFLFVHVWLSSLVQVLRVS